jgi:hypothetical protein
MATGPDARHISTMTQDTSRPAKSTDHPSKALAGWENEGGAHRSSVFASGEEHSNPAEENDRMLRDLGAAVISQWNFLPSAIQRKLFAHAVAVDAAHHTVPQSRQIARFLHRHKNDGAPR